jgi:hypothetical protein
VKLLQAVYMAAVLAVLLLIAGSLGAFDRWAIYARNLLATGQEERPAPGTAGGILELHSQDMQDAAAAAPQRAPASAPK